MNEAIDFLTANTTVAYATAVFIFIITIVMLAKRLIGGIIFIILLAFALLSGLSIVNHDLFREILIGFKYEPEKFHEDTFTHYKNQIQRSAEEIKEAYEHQAKKIESAYDIYHRTNEIDKPVPTPSPAPGPNEPSK